MSSAVVPVKKETPVPAARFSPFVQLRREMDQLMNRFFGGFPALWDGLPPEPSWGIDMQDLEDSVQVRFEVPGFDAKEIDLRLTGNELCLRAAHKTESKDKGKEESSESSIYRSVMLPQEVIFEKAQAKYANGLLTVTLPKSEAGKGRKIAIQAS